MTDQGQRSAPRATSRGVRDKLLVAGIFVAGAVIGSLAAGALGHDPFGPPRGGPILLGMLPPHFEPERAAEHARRLAHRLSAEVNATAEQQNKLTVIMDSAAKDILPLRERMRAARAQLVDLLTGPTVSQADVEQNRGEQLAIADAIGKRLSAAAFTAAEVLKPEQRRLLAEHLKAFR
jgi:periplasmic protein CpxP/Spy